MLNRLASIAMSTSLLKALPGKLDIKRHSLSILSLYIYAYWVHVGVKKNDTSSKYSLYIYAYWVNVGVKNYDTDQPTKQVSNKDMQQSQAIA